MHVYIVWEIGRTLVEEREDLERRLQYLRELRREVFGAEVAEALFGEQEARWFADLERRRIARDDG